VDGPGTSQDDFSTIGKPPDMTIELSKQDRSQAIASIERYFQQNLDDSWNEALALHAHL